MSIIASELASLMHSIQRVGTVIERAYGADALTVACQASISALLRKRPGTDILLQDGKAAGQSVPHIHFHLLPRKAVGDNYSDNNDAVYPALEEGETALASELKKPQTRQAFKVDADENRLPRSREEMEAEASWLRTFFNPEETSNLS